VQQTTAAPKKKKHTSRTMTPDYIIFNVISAIILAVFATTCVIPFYLIIVASFSTEANLLVNGYAMYIQDFTMEAYNLALKNSVGIIRAYINTIFVTIVAPAAPCSSAP